jgi:hypothetical protein
MIKTALVILIIFNVQICFANSNFEVIKTDGTPAEIEVKLQYGITSEVLDLARQFYEDNCMLEDANNEREHLGMPLLESVCPSIVKDGI